MTEPAHREDPGTPDAAKPDIPDYTLLRRIGRGSYGDVWLARSVTGVFRVIKVVQRSRFEDDRPYHRELEGISRFQAAVSGRPRQLALLHVGRNDDAGYFYYVMEPADDAESGSAIDPDRYVPLTLREMVRRRGRLPAHECVEFTLELARGLAVLHGENLIHRDIKPSNVIFVQRTPKLADVGLVASADATLTGVGTPGYLPPEGPGSVAADIYSLGKVLYQIATGMDQSQYPRIPRELATHPDALLLREINSIVLKACSPYPAQRHPSADILARDLELIQAGRSVAFYEEFRKRSRRIVAITATLALVAGLAAALFVWRSQILQRANEQTRRALYRSDLAVAQLARTSGDLGRARSALARQIPQERESDLRGLEWSILAEAVRGEGSPLEPIPNPVAVTRIAADPNGRWVAASLTDDRVAVWDLHNGRIAKIITNARVLGGFLADSQIVVDEPDRAIRYESPTNGSGVRIQTNMRLRQLLPDGRVCLITPSGDIVIKIIHSSTGTLDREYNLSQRLPDTRLSESELSPDGRMLLWAGYKEVGAIRERFLVAFDLVNDQAKWRFDPKSRIVWVRCSPNQRYAAVNTGGLIPIILDLSNPNIQRPLEGHTARVQDAAFSPDGLLIATGSADQTIRMWDVSQGKQVSIHRGMGRPCTAIAWLPDGKHFIAGDDAGSVQAFSTQTKPRRTELTGMYADVHGDLVFDNVGGRSAITMSTNSIAIIETKDLSISEVISNVFQPIRFTPNGRQLTAFANDWSIVSIDMESGRRQLIGKPLPNGFSVDSWVISKTQKDLVMTGDEGQIVIINIDDGTCITSKEPDSERIWGTTFSPDGSKIFTASANGSIKTWDRFKGTLIAEETRIQDGDLQAIVLSPDGRWLAVSLFNDSSVRVWDTTRKEWRGPWFVHRRFVQGLLFSNSGNRLISGGADGRVVLWRVPDFEEVATFEVNPISRPTGDEGISVLRLTPDERVLGALTEDGRLQVWRSLP